MATPVAWLGLLFAIMCVAAQSQKVVTSPGSQQDLQDMAERFREKIVQCLVLTDYVNGGPYVLETLMLYLATEILRRKDAEIGVWMLLGTVVQLAMHMGYHRDPAHFKGMSAFAGEMRRRVWATVLELDLGISAQMGLPRLVKEWQADTKEPSNLHDTDFDTTTINLPPSRPESEQTPILYRLVRARFKKIIGFIWDLAADSRLCSYSEVMSLDTKLHGTHASVPQCFRWRSMSHCITESSQHILQKVSLEIMFHRARIMLHRRYLHSPSAENQHSYSRQACLDAALKLLEYQHILQEETQPFGQLYKERWKVSSLVSHDFLLATSILCYYLQCTRGQGLKGPEASMVETIRESLRKSHDIWLRSSGSSKEARKVASALSVILGVRAPPAASSNQKTTSSPFQTPSSFGNNNGYGDLSCFGVPFSIFDMPLVANYPTPGDDTVESLSTPMPNLDFGWSNMDGKFQCLGQGAVAVC